MTGRLLIRVLNRHYNGLKKLILIEESTATLVNASSLMLV